MQAAGNGIEDWRWSPDGGPANRANNGPPLSCVCHQLNCKVNGQNVKSKPNKRGVTGQQQGGVEKEFRQVAKAQVGLPKGARRKFCEHF